MGKSFVTVSLRSPVVPRPPPLDDRLRIVWCQRLARAEDEEARQRIETEMEASPETRAILDALHATRASGGWTGCTCKLRAGGWQAEGREAVAQRMQAAGCKRARHQAPVAGWLPLQHARVRPPLLAPLPPTAARERQSAVERSIREEARRLRQGQGGEGGGAGGAAAAGRKAVDLDNLSFHQGSHFNSSKQCTLPQVRGQDAAGCPGCGGGSGRWDGQVLSAGWRRIESLGRLRCRMVSSRGKPLC